MISIKEGAIRSWSEPEGALCVHIQATNKEPTLIGIQFRKAGAQSLLCSFLSIAVQHLDARLASQEVNASPDPGVVEIVINNSDGVSVVRVDNIVQKSHCFCSGKTSFGVVQIQLNLDALVFVGPVSLAGALVLVNRDHMKIQIRGFCCAPVENDFRLPGVHYW